MLDPKDVREGDCLECGRERGTHEWRYGAEFCTDRVFTPKLPQPRATPGIKYACKDYPKMGTTTYAVGRVDGGLWNTNFGDFAFTPDWQEVE